MSDFDILFGKLGIPIYQGFKQIISGTLFKTCYNKSFYEVIHNFCVQTL